MHHRSGYSEKTSSGVTSLLTSNAGLGGESGAIQLASGTSSAGG